MLEDKLTRLVASAVEALGFELVGVEYLAQGAHSILRVFIDSEQGITLDNCSKVSHQISGVLEVEDLIRGKFNLEVSSPGLDRPLFTLAHFQRFTGEDVKLRLRQPLNGQRKFKGVISAVENERIQIVLDENQVLELEIDEIEKANLIPKL
ncbi:Bacterial ribosome SSU maturation protein RimP [hydrothermal vent metagenome]|uniref:Bacterial ribosome SSU maturation protein RimP n=1 Tax=hydrothermal vent metagenome TaxID=652676 RepID=A0A3B1B396_9ZZZZ